MKQNAAFRFTDEEMETAKGTDLLDLLKRLGYTVHRLGSRYHTTREINSIRIKERRTWKRYSNGTGGDAISSSQSPLNSVSAYGKNSVHSRAPPSPIEPASLGFDGNPEAPIPHSKPAQKKEKPVFTLPIAHVDQRRVFASKRGTYDLNSSGFKGDVPGSNKDVAFRLPCDPALDWVAVFEAPIDLMSFCTLYRQVWSNAVALCGLYQGPLDTYRRENPHLKRIVLCLDADGPGREAAEKFQAEYGQKGYDVSTRTPA